MKVLLKGVCVNYAPYFSAYFFTILRQSLSKQMINILGGKDGWSVSYTVSVESPRSW